MLKHNGMKHYTIIFVQVDSQREIKDKCDQTNCHSKRPVKNSWRTAKVLFGFPFISEQGCCLLTCFQALLPDGYIHRCVFWMVSDIKRHAYSTKNNSMLLETGFLSKNIFKPQIPI